MSVRSVGALRNVMDNKMLIVIRVMKGYVILSFLEPA